MRGMRMDPLTERRVLELYQNKELKLSMLRIGELLHICPKTARHILLRNNVRVRSISEACMRYAKTDFSGDLDEKARVLGFINDCSIDYSSRQILVRTSTTHHAQISLFNQIFGRYGHVNELSGYNSRFPLY